MKTHFKIIFILQLVVSANSHGQSLNDYLNEAAESNSELKASYLEFEASMQRIPQVRALEDPKLSFGYFISPIETRVGAQLAKISLTQSFPWFGTLKSKEKETSLMAEAKYQDFLNAKNELFLKVKQAYYPIYEVQEHIRWQEENLAILSTYKKLATTSFSNSKGTMVDVIRADIMMTNTETDIALLKDQLFPLQVAFNSLLNRNEDANVVIIDSLSLDYPDKYQKDAISNQNPQLNSMDLKIQAADAMKSVVRKNGLPKIGFGLDYAFISNRSEANVTDNGKNAFMPMVSMSLPIFHNKNKASIKEAELIKETFINRKEGLRNELSSAYETAWYNLQKARQLFLLYDNQIIKTQQALNLLNSAYSNSGKDFDEVLGMQQQLLKYEMAKASALVDFYLAKAEIEFITSKQN